jgi:ParB family chromosome partitioning protein
MSKKLAAKASLIQLPPAAAGAAGRIDPGARESRIDAASEPRMKTAPGSMAHFMASQSAAVKEADDLRERLKAFDGATPVRMLDPRHVQPSRWANRHEAAYADADFAELKAEIASAGGNVQPVSVRPLKVPVGGPAPADDGALRPTHELVFGHRRHRACLELGLPLQAMVVDVDDQALFEAMERENRARKNLSAWEQGRMYRRALDEGLYPSQRKLSEALGVDVALVSKSLSLARLPTAVVNAFASPLDIQFRWAQPLAEALQRDPDGVLARAARVQPAGQKLPAAAVLARLLGHEDAALLNRSTPDHQVIQGAAGRQALITRDSRGRVVVNFPAGALSPAAQAELAVQIEALLARG